MAEFKHREKLREALETNLKRYTGNSNDGQREYTYDFGIHWRNVVLTDNEKEILINKALPDYLIAIEKDGVVSKSYEAINALEQTYKNLLIQNSERFLSDVLESMKSPNGDNYNLGARFPSVPLSDEQKETLIDYSHFPICGGISGNFSAGAVQKACSVLVEAYERHYGKNS